MPNMCPFENFFFLLSNTYETEQKLFLKKNFLFLKKKVGSLKKTSFFFFSKGHILGILILVS